MTKDRLDRVVHDAGNADGRQNLPQGEMENVAVEFPSVGNDAPPEIAEPSLPSFLPMPKSSGSRELSNEVEPGIVVQDRCGLAHDGHVDINPYRYNPDSMDAHAANDVEVEGTHEEVWDPPSEMDVGIVDNKADDDLRELLAILQRDEKAEIREANDEILAVIRSLGGSSGKYRRERQKALRTVV